jgi:hypothetical protein
LISHSVQRVHTFIPLDERGGGVLTGATGLEIPESRNLVIWL